MIQPNLLPLETIFAAPCFSHAQGALPFIRETLVNSYIAYMGDPEIPAQNDEMFARSPVSRLDQVRCPVLVVHGAQDVRVSLGQAEAVVSSLRAHGAEVEFLVNPAEGHWFINEESNHQLYRTIESFLSRHIRHRAPD
ncbi:MAG: alpha/beta hydrolase family protein [Paracoccus sp. (in: a-proteobacteria)]